VKIPKRVNNSLDWFEDNIRGITIVTALAVVSAAALWMPALAALVLGALMGGITIHWRMTRRLARLRTENDNLLRETGALRHEKTMLAQGVISSSGQLTQKLPIIHSVDNDNGDTPLTQRLPIIPWDNEGSEDTGDTPLLGVTRPRR
jgi:hypothetical protein